MNKSGKMSQSKYKGNNNSNALDASDLDVEIKSGQENIDDDEIVDESEFDLQTKNENKNQIDMQEKKNKMLYDDDD